MKIQHKFCLAAIMAAFILPAFAEAIPAGSFRDSRIQTAVYHDNQVYHIRGQVGRAVLVQLEEGETLSGDSAALGMGDSDAWKVAVKGNNIIFKPTVTKPATNMLIVTNKRTYAFTLSLANEQHKKQAPTYILRFSYPDTIAAKQSEAMARDRKVAALFSKATDNIQIHNDNYWGYGNKALAPTAMWDNGLFTYLRFNNNKDLPTIYKVADDGTEALVNSHIEKNMIVVHETAPRFVLRLGKSVLGINNRGYDAVGHFNRTGTSSTDTVRIVK
jgi:type IV secretion system protein VirB9